MDKDSTSARAKNFFFVVVRHRGRRFGPTIRFSNVGLRLVYEAVVYVVVVEGVLARDLRFRLEQFY